MFLCRSRSGQVIAQFSEGVGGRDQRLHLYGDLSCDDSIALKGFLNQYLEKEKLNTSIASSNGDFLLILHIIIPSLF